MKRIKTSVSDDGRIDPNVLAWLLEGQKQGVTVTLTVQQIRSNKVRKLAGLAKIRYRVRDGRP